MSTYSALCDVPVEALDFLINLLRRHYRTHDHRSTQRGGTARTQATLVLRSFGDTGPPPSFGPVAVRVVGFRLMGALPSVVDGCEVAER